MDNARLGIRILKLWVGDESIAWTVSKGNLAGLEKPILSPEPLPFHVSRPRENAIDFLVKVLQFLTDRYRDEHEEVVTLSYELVSCLGELLYQTLFTEDIHQQLLDLLNDKQVELLRIQLEFRDKQASQLERWPWEYLRIPFERDISGSGQFLAQVTELMLNRMLSLRNVEPRELTTAEPVKVLVVASSPKGHTPVKADKVTEVIENLPGPKKVEVGELIQPEYKISDNWKAIVTRKAFKDKLEEFKPHILHFIGHGWRNPQGGGGQIALVKSDGDPDPVDATLFAKWAAASKNLKLVFLQVCESALPDRYIGVSSVAQRLAHRNIPAVVAMQSKVDREVTNAFAESFYQSLTEGNPVDVAVKAGRDAISGLPEAYGQHLAFGLPVLYLRGYEGMFPRDKDPSREPRIGDQYTRKCPAPNCNTPIRRADQKVCTGCGLRLVCSSCETPLDDPLGNFCGHCAEPITPRPSRPVPADKGVSVDAGPRTLGAFEPPTGSSGMQPKGA